MSQLDRAKSELADLEREIYGTHEQQRLMELELNVRTAGGFPGDAGPPDTVARQQLAALQLELA